MRVNKAIIMTVMAATTLLAGCGQGNAQSSDVPVEETMVKQTETEGPLTDETVTTEISDEKEIEDEIREKPEDAIKNQDSEEDLKSVLLAKCQDTLMVMIRDDFDGDGIYEAFAATSKDPYAVYYNDPDNASDCYDDYTIWYVAQDMAYAIDDVSFGPNFVSLKQGVFADGTKAVIVDCFMSNVDTDSYIFVVANGTYKFIGTHTSSSIAEDGLLYSGHLLRDIDANYFETEVYEYSDGELILKDSYREDW